MSLCELLSAAGYAMSVAKSGIDALRALESNLPDVVIADIGMHGMNGALLARIIGEMYPRLPVIFTTGMSADNDLLAHLPPQSIVLYKPVLLEEVTDTIERLRAGY
nr:response regulator [Caballeronia sp. NK8]